MKKYLRAEKPYKDLQTRIDPTKNSGNIHFYTNFSTLSRKCLNIILFCLRSGSLKHERIN